MMASCCATIHRLLTSASVYGSVVVCSVVSLDDVTGEQRKKKEMRTTTKLTARIVYRATGRRMDDIWEYQYTHE